MQMEITCAGLDKKNDRVVAVVNHRAASPSRDSYTQLNNSRVKWNISSRHKYSVINNILSWWKHNQDVNQIIASDLPVQELKRFLIIPSFVQIDCFYIIWAPAECFR